MPKIRKQIPDFPASPDPIVLTDQPMPASVKPVPKEDLAHVLNYTREHWAEAQGRSFFITGGTGFFGMWVLESFAYINDTLGLSMRATVLTRDPLAFASKAPYLTARADLTFIRGDVRFF